MAKITMEMIKELREKTQVGMMDCKNALIQAEGDLERAIEILRKKGAAVAAKRAENVTNNGTIAAFISPDGRTGALLEVSCETDFSANTADMKNFAQTVCEHLTHTPQCCEGRCEPDCLIEQTLFNNPDKTVKVLLEELIAKISENIKLSKCARFDVAEEGLINAYVHPGATQASIVELEVKGLNDGNKGAIEQLARDLCMQVTVSNPLAIKPEELDAQELEKERCIIIEQIKSEGDRPAELVEKIISGKMNKYFEEVCLTNQKYIKQDKISVAKHIEAVEKETNTTITIKQFKRFAIGA